MDNMSEKTLRISIVAFALMFLYSTVMWGKKNVELKKQKSEIEELSKQVDNLQQKSDSLYSELFPTQIELGRYEIAYEIFKERNPKAASQYGDIISNETE